MVLRILIGLLFAIGICSCAESPPKKQIGTYFGTSVHNSSRRGRSYTDSSGTVYAYRCFKATITNDSLIPMHLEINFPNQYDQLIPFNGQQFRAFLMPETMTPEKQFNVDFYDTEVKRFLDRQLKIPVTLNKTLKPGEQCFITIGFLSDTAAHLEPIRMVLFSKGHNHNCPSIPGGPLPQYESAKNQLTLLLGLDFCIAGGDFSACCSVIPCGEISFPD